MKIHVLCNDGSPLGVTPETIYGDTRRVGVGGAELALLTLCELWAGRGDEVVLYNDPWNKTDKLDQRPIGVFEPKEPRDFLIVFRSPNTRSFQASGKKIWWSCDQYTINDFRSFGHTVSKIVTISEFHREYFKKHYGHDSIVIDLPVRNDDYLYDQEPERISYRLLFSSVPDRGLSVLADVYQAIKQRVPEVSLVITSDYRLWGSGPNNSQYRSKFFSLKDVIFRGAISRKDLIKEQVSSEVLAYPCTYDELFCYAVAEAQYAGCYPITSGMGAVQTTNMGTILAGNPHDTNWKREYVNRVVEYLCLPEEMKLRNRIDIEAKARIRFNPTTILAYWDSKVFND